MKTCGCASFWSCTKKKTCMVDENENKVMFDFHGDAD